MYIVIELQTTGDQVGTIVNAYSARGQAESRYHTILAAAAISEVETHGAVMLTEEGQLLLRGCYHHGRPVDTSDDVVIGGED